MKINYRNTLLLIFLFFGIAGSLYFILLGKPIDSFNNVSVYYNGHTGNIFKRNTSADKYNIGLKYQCVEFVKRYYYEHLNHKMPDSYGNAVDFFDPKLKDGQKNQKRNLTQYTNPSQTKPKTGDLIVFGKSKNNQFGHVAIISKVDVNSIEIIQQNPGIFGSTRASFSLTRKNRKWKIKHNRILGWLRKE